MKNFIKTWAYRFDATLGPCLVVYAVMALLNAQCIYQTKLSDHPGMGAWFAASIWILFFWVPLLRLL